MKHIKKFNEGFFDFLKGERPRTVCSCAGGECSGRIKDKKGKSSNTDSTTSTRYSSINKEDNSLIPFNLFHKAPEIRNIVEHKIKNLEKDNNFIEIMDMIKNGEIKKAKTDVEKNYFRIGNNAKFVLNDGRVISINPIKTWESSDGDYDVYYIMSVDKSPLGYISRSNYNYILGEVKKSLDF